MSAPSSHVRPMLAQAVSQSSDTPRVVVVQGWLLSWLEHEGPRETGVRMEALPTYDAAALVRRAVAANASATIALRLDVEGDEWWILRALVAEPALLCKISYLFVEFHGSATAAQRAAWGAFLRRYLVERPQLRLLLHLVDGQAQKASLMSQVFATLEAGLIN